VVVDLGPEVAAAAEQRPRVDDPHGAAQFGAHRGGQRRDHRLQVDGAHLQGRRRQVPGEIVHVGDGAHALAAVVQVLRQDGVDLAPFVQQRAAVAIAGVDHGHRAVLAEQPHQAVHHVAIQLVVRQDAHSGAAVDHGAVEHDLGQVGRVPAAAVEHGLQRLPVAPGAERHHVSRRAHRVQRRDLPRLQAVRRLGGQQGAVHVGGDEQALRCSGHGRPLSTASFSR
jgi:hypothetical protein